MNAHHVPLMQSVEEIGLGKEEEDRKKASVFFFSVLVLKKVSLVIQRYVRGTYYSFDL
jgi:hypothetical protein